MGNLRNHTTHNTEPSVHIFLQTHSFKTCLQNLVIFSSSDVIRKCRKLQKFTKKFTKTGLQRHHLWTNRSPHPRGKSNLKRTGSYVAPNVLFPTSLGLGPVKKKPGRSQNGPPATVRSSRSFPESHPFANRNGLSAEDDGFVATESYDSLLTVILDSLHQALFLEVFRPHCERVQRVAVWNMIYLDFQNDKRSILSLKTRVVDRCSRRTCLNRSCLEKANRIYRRLLFVQSGTNIQNRQRVQRAHHLLDNWPIVQLLGDEVRCCANELHSSLISLEMYRAIEQLLSMWDNQTQRTNRSFSPPKGWRELHWCKPWFRHWGASEARRKRIIYTTALVWTQQQGEF